MAHLDRVAGAVTLALGLLAMAAVVSTDDYSVGARTDARSYKVIKRIARVALSADVLDNSATLPPAELSPAQAIHLASALAVKPDLTAFVAYDEHLLAAAKAAGLPVTSPGSS